MSYPTDRLRFLPEKRVTLAAAVAVTIVATLAAFAPSFATDAEAYKLEVVLRGGADGKTLVHTAVSTPEGLNVLENSVTVIGDEPVRFSTSRGDTTFNIEVKNAGDGTVFGTLEVTRAGRTIYQTTTEHDTSRPRRPFPPRAPAPDDSLTPSGYYRVGGDVIAPRVIKRVEPYYPNDAREARVAGIVIIEVLIDETGVVRGTKILKPLPFGLDQAAAVAVRQWEFAPGLKDGKPVPVIFNLTVSFKPQ